MQLHVMIMMIWACHDNILDNNRIFKDAKQETGGARARLKTSQTRDLFGVNNGLGGRRARSSSSSGKVNTN